MPGAEKGDATDGRGPAAEAGLTTAAAWIRAVLLVGPVLVIAGVWGYRELGPATTAAEAGPAVPAAAAPEALEGFRTDAFYLPDDSMLGFVEIPAGPFTMGSDPADDPMAFDVERWSSDRSQGTVELPTFYLGRYEVTVAQFAAFVEATGHPVQEGTLEAPPDHPVTGVAWTDAVAYARWLEGALRASEAPPPAIRSRLEEGWRVSLPSEAEWEKAARGTDGRIFPWGDEPRRDRANFQTRGTQPVGSFECPECPYPVSDMSGNAWEWTRSPYQPYPYDDADDRANLNSDALWVMRGGSYQDGPRNIRAALRGGAAPGVHRPFIGFRVALTPR